MIMQRPLSPFMFPTWYRFQLTSAMSILHRLTGIALTVGSILLAWWLVEQHQCDRRQTADPAQHRCVTQYRRIRRRGCVCDDSLVLGSASF
jgi:hypothetical protein